MHKATTRRDFLKQASAVSAGMAIGGLGMPTESYGRVIGANDRINFAVVGLHARGMAHLESLTKCKNTSVSHMCEVDQRYVQPFSEMAEKAFGQAPVLETDFRKLMEIKAVDAITVATPEHWHAPMAIMGLQAGKHVYLEKPCSHNPRESELLVQAQKKYKPLIQMGNQQRSSEHTIHIIKKIKEGLIGDVYYASAWYANKRGPIGVGKEIPVPDYLDWDLWQGPAPRRPYKDNLHPYNWHWFWHYGTGETLNNGTHEVDVCRWALGVDYPRKVTTSGGRYHFKDDWEFYDTLVTGYDYGDKTIVWEGLSCQGKKTYNRGRGSLIHGTEGTILIDRTSYIHFDRKEKIVEEVKVGGNKQNDTSNLIGGGDLTTKHVQNLINAIRTGEKLNSPIEDASISVDMLLLSNIAWKKNRSLDLDPKTGRILDDKDAMTMWGREYEKGWEPKV
ncbi:Gfo/Idh/MocA family oxidoreductase [Planctomycetota bacterium]